MSLLNEAKLNVLREMYENNENFRQLEADNPTEAELDGFFSRALTFVSDPDKWRNRWEDAKVERGDERCAWRRCPEHGPYCPGPTCCCADKHDADPVPEQPVEHPADEVQADSGGRVTVEREDLEQAASFVRTAVSGPHRTTARAAKKSTGPP